MFKFSLFPRGDKFFVMLEQSAQNAVKIALQLRDLVNLWENIKERVGIISDFEHEGDGIKHQIIAQLNRTLITPFDREDIALLTHALDGIDNLIHTAAETMLIYKVERPNQKISELVNLIVQATGEIGRAVSEIRYRIEQKGIKERCIEIHRLENAGDSIHRSVMSELFADSTDIAYILKWREIYKYLEAVLDKCEDVANILEGISIKYA